MQLLWVRYYFVVGCSAFPVSLGGFALLLLLPLLIYSYYLFYVFYKNSLGTATLTSTTKPHSWRSLQKKARGPSLCTSYYHQHCG